MPTTTSSSTPARRRLRLPLLPVCPFHEHDFIETTGTEIQPHESVEMTEVVPKEDLDEVQVQMEEEEEEENQPSIYSRIFTGIRVI